MGPVFDEDYPVSEFAGLQSVNSPLVIQVSSRSSSSRRTRNDLSAHSVLRRQVARASKSASRHSHGSGWAHRGHPEPWQPGHGVGGCRLGSFLGFRKQDGAGSFTGALKPSPFPTPGLLSTVSNTVYPTGRFWPSVTEPFASVTIENGPRYVASPSRLAQSDVMGTALARTPSACSATFAGPMAWMSWIDTVTVPLGFWVTA